jgi:LacI family transcriptional regulator
LTRATLKDVAVHAGVSHQTVSNVLNNHPSIRPAMRERVLHSIRALDYHPNSAAKALREARITTLCCIFYNQHTEDIEDPYRNLIQSALIAESTACDYSLTTAFLDERPERFEALRRGFLQRQFGAGVVVGASLTEQVAQPLLAWGLPIVLFDVGLPPGTPLELPAITADYAGGMEALVAHHVERGRKRLCLLIPPDSEGITTVARREGYQRAMQTAGLPPQTVAGDWSFASGEQAFIALWNGHDQGPDQRPDALICANDRMAVGALVAARRLGVEVPAEIAISGFDDFEFARFTAPSLTTVRVPYGEMARQAVRTLLERLENPQAQVASHQWPVALVVRESS